MITVRVKPEWIHGAVSIETTDEGAGIRPWRLPYDRLELFPPRELQNHGGTTAGIRVRFATTSSKVGLAVEKVLPESIFDLVVDEELVESRKYTDGEVLFEGLPTGRKTVEIWLPQVSPVLIRNVLVEEDAEVEDAPDERPVWVTYGSSITHCADAYSPARTWPAVAARKGGLNLVCMGFGGNCHLEPMVAMTIRDLKADLISLKVGINIYGASSLSTRTFRPAIIGFVNIIREKHPDTPIAVISPILSPPREETSNAVNFTLKAMREEVADAVERLRSCGDRQIVYFSGLELLDESLAEHLPDDLHPDGYGYEQMGYNFVEKILPTLKQMMQ